MKLNPFRAVYPDLNAISSPDDFFDTVKETFPHYRGEGIFLNDSAPAIYIYRIKTPEESYTGIVGCATVDDYLNNKIKKHENTLAAKEQQQMELTLKRNASVKPVLLAYRTIPEINQFVREYTSQHEPLFCTVLNNKTQTHTFWKIDKEADISYIQNLFATRIPHSYIADGHHRTSTAALLNQTMQAQGISGNYDQILAAFFPVSNLTIFDYNRIVEGLDKRTMARFMARIAQVFDIEIMEEAAKPRQKFELTMLVGEEWFRLKWKTSVLAQFKEEEVLLDANLLDQKVMKGIMKIKDTTLDERIKYVEGPRGFEYIADKTKTNPNKIAFCLFPVAIEDLFKIADAGKIMPPKSTWFEPRVKNGLLVLEYKRVDDEKNNRG